MPEDTEKPEPLTLEKIEASLSPNTRIWLRGLGAAFIGAFSTSILTSAIDPTKFNFSVAGMRSLAGPALASGALATFFYLKKSPMPSSTKSTETISEISASADGTVTTTRTLTVIRKGA